MKLEVVEWSTGNVVHTVDVSGRSEQVVDATERGMLRNVDRDRYGVRRSDEN